MAQTTILGLPLKATPDATDVVEIQEAGGASRRTTAAGMAARTAAQFTANELETLSPTDTLAVITEAGAAGVVVPSLVMESVAEGSPEASPLRDTDFLLANRDGIKRVAPFGLKTVATVGDSADLPTLYGGSDNNGEPNTGVHAKTAALTGDQATHAQQSVIFVLDFDATALLINARKYSSNRNELVAYGFSTNATNRGVRLTVDHIGQLEITVQGADNRYNQRKLFGSYIRPGRQHAVVMWDCSGSAAGVYRCWVNGRRVKPITGSGNPGDMSLAAGSAGNRVFSVGALRDQRSVDATFYDVQFWSIADTDIPADLDLMSAQLFLNRGELPSVLKNGSTEDADSWPSLRGWYRFNELSGTSIIDHSDATGSLGPLVISGDLEAARAVRGAFTSRSELYSFLRTAGDTAGLSLSTDIKRTGARSYRMEVNRATDWTSPSTAAISVAKPITEAPPILYGETRRSSAWWYIGSGFNAVGDSVGGGGVWTIQEQYKTFDNLSQDTNWPGENPKFAWGFRRISGDSGDARQVVVIMREALPNPPNQTNASFTNFDRFSKSNTIGGDALPVPNAQWVKITVEYFAHETDGYVKVWQAVDGAYGDTLIIDTTAVGPINTWSQLGQFAEKKERDWKALTAEADGDSAWWHAPTNLGSHQYMIYMGGGMFLTDTQDQVLYIDDIEVEVLGRPVDIWERTGIAPVRP